MILAYEAAKLKQISSHSVINLKKPYYWGTEYTGSIIGEGVSSPVQNHIFCKAFSNVCMLRDVKAFFRLFLPNIFPKIESVVFPLGTFQ